VIRSLLACLAPAFVASAQTILVTTNNYNDLNPERDAVSGPEGSFRITHTVTDGSSPQSFEFLEGEIKLRVVNQADLFTNSFATAFVTNDPGTVRWTVTNLTAGTYSLDSDVVIGGDTVKIFWRYLTVTQACTTCTESGGSGSVSLSTTVNVYNVVSAGPTNINGITGGTLTIDTLGYGLRTVTNGNTITLVSDLAYPSPGVAQLFQTDGVSNYWGALSTPAPSPAFGTNVYKWSTPLVTNTWLLPSTQTLLRAWAASGGGYSCPGGYGECIPRLPVGTPIKMLVGKGGNSGSVAWSSHGYPYGGRGQAAGFNSDRLSGGGATIAWIGDEPSVDLTNVLFVIGASGGGNGTTLANGAGAPGGGFYYGAQDAYDASNTNTFPGYGAWALDIFGTGAMPGSNSFGHASANGGLLAGGWAYPYPDGVGTNTSDQLGGGGGGMQGGGAAVKATGTAAISGGIQGGGGGLTWFNTNLVHSAKTFRGPTAAGGEPVAADTPSYTAGAGVGAYNGSGLDGAIGGEW
jgi:hypothetical protein